MREVEFLIFLADGDSQGNNKYLASYDTKQESIQIMCHIIYGHAISMVFQKSEFKWKNHETFGLNKYTDKFKRMCYGS